jgi:hypothetical protein
MSPHGIILGPDRGVGCIFPTYAADKGYVSAAASAQSSESLSPQGVGFSVFDVSMRNIKVGLAPGGDGCGGRIFWFVQRRDINSYCRTDS